MKLIALIFLWVVFFGILTMIGIPFPYSAIGALIMACLAVLSS